MRSYATTRRGLVAAAAAFAAAFAAKRSHAMARPPRRTDPSCFLSGTRIRTPGGEVEVDDLAIGDLVDTVSGAAKPIKWIGRWRFERGRRWATDVLPVKVARSALGALIPHSDLFLSPAHAVYVDGLLVPVRNLINGRSIVKCSSFNSDTIEYLHIELFAHDAIFAEGAPTETLWTTGDHAFDNLVDDHGTYPPGVPTQSEPFAPRVLLDRRADMRSRLRTAYSPLIDRRQPIDVIWERLAERAETEIAA